MELDTGLEMAHLLVAYTYSRILLDLSREKSVGTIPKVAELQK